MIQSAIGPQPATQTIRALKTALTDRISTTVFAADPDLSVAVAAVDYISSGGRQAPIESG